MKNKNQLFGIIIFFALLLLVSGCTTEDFKKLKTEDNIGKTVSVKGTVENPYKLGTLSGYTLKDKLGEPLQVKAETLQKKGAVITVQGVLMKDPFFSYYLKAKE